MPENISPGINPGDQYISGIIDIDHPEKIFNGDQLSIKKVGYCPAAAD